MANKTQPKAQSPIKVHPKTRLGMQRTAWRHANADGVGMIATEMSSACDLLHEGDREAQDRARVAICTAMILAGYAEADRQGLNLVEVDRVVGLFRAGR
jgi:hypothetical protein